MLNIELKTLALIEAKILLNFAKRSAAKFKRLQRIAG